MVEFEFRSTLNRLKNSIVLAPKLSLKSSLQKALSYVYTINKICILDLLVTRNIDVIFFKFEYMDHFSK